MKLLTFLQTLTDTTAAAATKVDLTTKAKPTHVEMESWLRMFNVIPPDHGLRPSDAKEIGKNPFPVADLLDTATNCSVHHLESVLTKPITLVVLVAGPHIEVFNADDASWLATVDVENKVLYV